MRCHCVGIIFLGLLLGGGSLFAGHNRPVDPPDQARNVRLVKDLNPAAEARNFLQTSPLVPLGNAAYFLGGPGDWSTAEGGLWVTDGTVIGTRLVRSFAAEDGMGAVSTLVAAGGRLFFFAPNGGVELFVWTSNGTAAGTQPLAPCGSIFYEPPRLVAAGGRAFFFRYPAAGTDLELWASDGTPEGTRRLAEFIGHDTIYDVGHLTAWGDRIAFRGWDREHGQEFWTSDGTPEGTRLLKDLVPGPAASTPSNFLEWNGRLVFTALEGEYSPWRLWSSDGTDMGTVPITDTPVLEWGAEYTPLYAGGDYLYFWAYTQDHPPGLWRTDGEPGGSVFLREIEVGGGIEGFWAELTPDTILFNGYDADHGYELWRSDGTPEGTRRVRDIMGGMGSSWPYGLTAFGGAVYFSATEYDLSGQELWRSDGTEEGTVLVRDLNPGTLNASPDWIQVWNGRLWFMADDGEHGVEPWASDGTEEGTRPFGRLAPDVGSATVASLVPRGGGGALLTTGDWAHPPYGLWATDGTPEGTRVILAPDPVTTVRPPGPLAYRGDLAFLTLQTADLGNELWRTDGTTAGTRVVRDIVAGPADSIHPLYPVGAFMGDDYFFSASDGVHGLEPWTTDGTAPGTRMVADICTAPQDYNPTASSWPDRFAAGADLLFFTARGDDGNAGWYAGDGTAAGTRLLASFFVPSDQIFLQSPAVAGSTAFLFAREPWTSRWDLWRSDGTAAGTKVIALLNVPWDRPWTPGPFFPFGERVFFSAAYSFGEELWVSDGTAAGTHLFMDIHPGDSSSSPGDFAALGDRFYFRADDGVHGAELWASDGTEAGTFLLADLCPGPCSGYPMGMASDGERIVFSATDGMHGHELWVSDGTPAGTAMSADIQAGPASSAPERITPSGPTVYFTADDGRTGRELWRYDPGSP